MRRPRPARPELCMAPPPPAGRGQRTRETLIYLACAVLLCVPAIAPLLVDSLTCGYDNVFHLWRAVQVQHLLEQGVAFSRWAPDMAHGFGIPLFVFVSPASAYAAALLREIEMDRLRAHEVHSMNSSLSCSHADGG